MIFIRTVYNIFYQAKIFPYYVLSTFSLSLSTLLFCLDSRLLGQGLLRTLRALQTSVISAGAEDINDAY